MFKKKMRIIVLLAIAFVGSMMSFNTVNAATEKIKSDNYVPGPYYYAHTRESGSTTKLWEQVSFIERASDGAFVYCVQPFVRIKSNATYDVTTEDLNAVANISYENWKIMGMAIMKME